MKKINYLEGVRGLAAFLVFLHHFLLAFYPSHYYGDPTTTHTDQVEIWYYSSPFSFITNGNFMVAIFFVLSGFVLSRKYYHENDYKYLISATSRRFFRLFIPSFVAILISYIFIRLSLNYNVEASEITASGWLKKLYDVDHSFRNFIQEILYKTMFWGSNDFVPTLWSISTELFGSFLVFGLLFFTHNLRNKFKVFCLIIIVILSSFSKYYVAFILGMFLNYIPLLESKIKIRNNYFIILPLLVLGLLMGGFPSVGKVDGTFYEFLSNKSIVKNYILIHVVGGFILILSIYLSDSMQKMFSNRFFIFLGKISFSIYLLHPLIIGSFSSFSCVYLLKIVDSYNFCVLLVFVLTTLLSFIVSNYFATFIDSYSITAAKNIYVKYFEKKEL